METVDHEWRAMSIPASPAVQFTERQGQYGLAFEEVGREGALGQQRIGGEGLAADVFELVEERNDGADLVGALRLVVGAELQADFFWV